VRDIALRNAGRAVANGAMRRIMPDADDDLCRIVQTGRSLDLGRVRLD